MILALMHMCIVAESRGNGLGLVAALTGTEGAEIDFHETENIGIQRFEETDQALEIAVRTPQVAGTRNGKMKVTTGTSGVTNIVKDKAHAVFRQGKIYTGAVRLHMASELTRMDTSEAKPPLDSRLDEFAVFTDGDELYADMLWHIRNARNSVRLESYIFENDAIGSEFIEACCERAQAGVDVRLHLDALGSLALSISDAPDRLQAAGVQLRWFNPARLFRLFKLNRRNHRKLLVIDERIAWLGGFNIHDESSRRYSGTECWRDTQVRIEGPLARVAADFFDHLWQGRRSWRAAFDTDGDAFLVSNHNLRQQHRLRRLLKHRMRNAEKRIWLTTPYFMPDHGTQQAMARAARRGVDVRLLVPFKTDRPVTQWAARAAYSQLLNAGVRIYEFRPRLLHAKTAIVDDSWCTVGTANIDYRSFYVNFELNLISDRDDLAEILSRNFTDDLRVSREVTGEAWRRRSLTARFPEIIGWVARKFL